MPTFEVTKGSLIHTRSAEEAEEGRCDATDEASSATLSKNF